MNKATLLSALALASASMFQGAPVGSLFAFRRMESAPISRGYGGRRGRSSGFKNEEARNLGIPKAFRQYARRYGSNVGAMAQMHKQIPAPMLDHWRDRIEAALRVLVRY